MTRGATFNFGGSPWAHAEMDRDPDRRHALAQQALAARAHVSMVGSTPTGPWVVRVFDSTRNLRFAGHYLADVVEFGLERFAAGADDAGIRWTASADRAAHGHRGRAPRTLCGEPARDERTAYPERSRCQDCWRALDREAPIAKAS